MGVFLMISSPLWKETGLSSCRPHALPLLELHPPVAIVFDLQNREAEAMFSSKIPAFRRCARPDAGRWTALNGGFCLQQRPTCSRCSSHSCA